MALDPSSSRSFWSDFGYRPELREEFGKNFVLVVDFFFHFETGKGDKGTLFSLSGNSNEKQEERKSEEKRRKA